MFPKDATKPTNKKVRTKVGFVTTGTSLEGTMRATILGNQSRPLNTLTSLAAKSGAPISVVEMYNIQ
jgi:hypothetical protein